MGADTKDLPPTPARFSEKGAATAFETFCFVSAKMRRLAWVVSLILRPRGVLSVPLAFVLFLIPVSGVSSGLGRGRPFSDLPLFCVFPSAC